MNSKDDPKNSPEQLVFTTNIGDHATYKNESNSFLEGHVKLISMRGINISSDCGDHFVKWSNILTIDKSKKITWYNDAR